jgi:hypothetical protein
MQKLANGYILESVPFSSDHTAYFSNYNFNVILAYPTRFSNWMLPQKLQNKILYTIFLVFHMICPPTTVAERSKA